MNVFVNAIALGCLSLIFVNVSALTPTPAQIAAAKTNVRNAIKAKPTLGPKALRLSFHDCVSPKCDGCINLNVEDNKGLAEPITDLEKIFKDNSHDTQMSRADFWALSGIAAVEEGIHHANVMESRSLDLEDREILYYMEEIDFSPGRVDCGSSPTTNEVHTFPHPHMNNAELFAYFDTHFNFSPEQTTSLMGAHNLGKLTQANSGFSAPTWTFDPQSFDDNYYHVMVEESYIWTQINQGNETHPKYLWKCNDSDGGGSCGHMLNTDVELLLDIKADSKGKAGCTFDTCAEVPTADLVWTYNEDVEQFLADFRAVFTLLINRK